MLPSFASPEELSPAASDDDEDAEAEGTTRDREFHSFSPPEAAAGSRRAEELEEWKGVDEVDFVVSLDGDGRIGARSLRAGAAAALLGAATSEVPRGTAPVLVQRISMLRERENN